MDATAHRVRNFGTSIFTEMSALAAQHQAINLSQGFPDFAGPSHVKHAAVRAIEADHNQYAPSPGLVALRQAAADTYRTSYGVHCTADHVTVTNGATGALFATILALDDPGDEVIIFEPAYDAYVPDVLMAGGVPRFVRLEPLTEQGTRYREPDTEDQDIEIWNVQPATSAQPPSSDSQLPRSWSFDPVALRAAFSHKTRAIIINTPHNPTGKVFDRNELALIAELCAEYDAIAIADEVYDRMVYLGAHLPIATLPGMWERTVTINSTGKTFSMTGWKIGYTIAPPPLTDAIRRVHQFASFAVATPFQHAMAAALNDALTSDYYQWLLRFYRERRDLLVDVLNQAGLPVLPVAGTYFAMADITALGFTSDVAFCRYLTTEIGVAAIPPSAFYADPTTAPLLARFCFAKELATLHAAAERLRKLHSEVRR